MSDDDEKLTFEVVDAAVAWLRGDDELDAAAIDAACAAYENHDGGGWTPWANLTEFQKDESRADMRAALTAYLHETGLATALATAKGEVERCTHESATGIDQTPLDDPEKVWRCDGCGYLYQTTIDKDGIADDFGIEPGPYIAELTAALSTAKGERDAAVAVCEAAQTFRGQHESFHPNHWVAATPGKYCHACDFCAAIDALTTWRATLEAPHA